MKVVSVFRSTRTWVRCCRARVRRVRPLFDVECRSVVAILELCIEHGAHVVTTCENMADPGARFPTSSWHRGRARRGRRHFGDGRESGFAMDRLPVTLSQTTGTFRRIRVVRVVDASTRRAQLKRIGVGDPEAFGDAIPEVARSGHAGPGSSLRLVSKGWALVSTRRPKRSRRFSPMRRRHRRWVRSRPITSGIYQIARDIGRTARSLRSKTYDGARRTRTARHHRHRG